MPDCAPVQAPTIPVTVVVPAYNRAAMVARSLASVHAQQGARPAEVIVVDDASTDDTADVALRLGARVIVHERNGGEGAARNSGVAAAAHDWIALLDSDDEWLPRHLAQVWAARDGQVLVSDAALGHGPRPEHHRIYGWPGRRPRTLRSPRDLAFPDNIVNPSCALVRRDALRAAGGFPAGLRHAGDLHTWLRLLEHGTGRALPALGVRYHLHDGQVSAARGAMSDAHRAVVQEFAGRPWHDARLDTWLAVTAHWDEDRRGAVASALRSPRRAEGLARTLVWRRRVRRASRAAH
jgi:glycosyltransferase involved in cell wall biosynthesis